MELLVAANERLLNRKPGGFTSRRRLGALCALAVQESAQSEKGVYLGRAGMDRFSTAVTRSPLSSAASVVQKAVNCVTPLCHRDLIEIVNQRLRAGYAFFTTKPRRHDVI